MFTYSTLARSRTTDYVSLLCKFNIKKFVIERSTERTVFTDLMVGEITRGQLTELSEDFMFFISNDVLKHMGLDTLFPYIDFANLKINIKLLMVKSHHLEVRMIFNKDDKIKKISEKRNIVGFFIYVFTLYIKHYNVSDKRRLYWDLNRKYSNVEKYEEYHIALHTGGFCVMNQRLIRQYQRYYKSALG